MRRSRNKGLQLTGAGARINGTGSSGNTYTASLVLTAGDILRREGRVLLR